VARCRCGRGAANARRPDPSWLALARLAVQRGQPRGILRGDRSSASLPSHLRERLCALGQRGEAPCPMRLARRPGAAAWRPASAHSPRRQAPCSLRAVAASVVGVPVEPLPPSPASCPPLPHVIPCPQPRICQRHALCMQAWSCTGTSSSQQPGSFARDWIPCRRESQHAQPRLYLAP